MSFATGAFHALRYIPEVTRGVTPATPQTTALRHNSCTLELSKGTMQSQELRSDRQITDFRHGMQKVAGDIDFEVSWKEFDALLAAGFFGTWNTNVLKAGVTYQSFTFERAFSDVALYQVFTGCLIDKLSLSFKPGNIVSGKASIVGMGSGIPVATQLDDTPTASQTDSPYDTFSGVIKEGGTEIAVVTSLDINLSNNLTPAEVLGSNKPADVLAGRSNVTGTLSAYFKDAAMMTKFINEVESSLEFSLVPPGGDGLSKSYNFLLPRIKYSGSANPVSNEGPIVLNMPFQALLDKGATATNIQLTRTAS